MERDSPAIPARPNRHSIFLYVGPVLLFAAAVAYGVLEVHPANDTWIGLAAGRQILTADRFPSTDTFSYTVPGRIWYNQNWLTHAFQYWLYDAIAPDAVIYANWLLACSVFVLVLLAVYWRCATWVGALLAASVVALGCRDFLSPRPATVGFLCLAGLWALLCAFEGQRQRRRWWPIVLLTPLLLVWGNVHGSFVFGYGVLGLYVLHWGGLRAIRRRASVDGRQMVALVGAVAAAVVLTAILGPFGIHNFIHGQKVAGSAVWRDVAEWHPPYMPGDDFPPVWRFWTILAGSAAMLLACVLMRLLARGSSEAGQPNTRPRITLFDLAVLAVGLAMALWARRFAPIFLILGAPTAVAGVVLLLRTVRESWRRRMRTGVMVLAGLGGVGVAVATISRARADLVGAYADYPDFNLLERATCYDIVPHDALVFIDRNQLSVNLLAEWSLAGAVMLHAPTAKVFVDGRAQQVYDEIHYRQYHALFVAANTPASTMFRILDESGTDGVLLRLWQRGANLLDALEQSSGWVPVSLGPDHRLFLRVGSSGLEHLGDMLRRGEGWWPDSAAGHASRGFVWRSTAPHDLERAVSSWDRALRRNLELGSVCLRPLIGTLLELGRDGEARRRVEMYANLLNHPLTRIPEKRRAELRGVLEACRRDVEDATSGAFAPGLEFRHASISG